MGNFKQLFIFVEGPDDERIFDKVIKQRLADKYNFIKIVRYANSEPKIIKNLIQTLNNQTSSDYIFVSDFDARGDLSYCVTIKKEKIIQKFSNVIDKQNILIVKEEIESWYLAGISQQHLDKFKIKHFSNTEQVDKETFIKLIPKQFHSKTDFLIEILKQYDITLGQNRNLSLNYFANKYELMA